MGVDLMSPRKPLEALREAAAARAAALGPPQRGDEPWKYTPTAALVEGGFAPPTGDEPRAAPTLHVEGMDDDLVFVNGALVGRTEGHAAALSEGPHGLQALFATLADFQAGDRADGAGLWAQNTARFTDAALIDVPAGERPDAPIHIHFHTSAERPLQVSPRVFLRVGRGAEVTLVEHHTGNGPCWNNAVTEVLVEEGAILQLVRIQEQDAGTFHTGATFIHQAADSQVSTFDFGCGARLARSEVQARLRGRGAECRLYGLYLLDGERHSDHHTVVLHEAPNSTSAELYKGVLQDRSRGVFTGRVVVGKDVRGCNTRQENPNLLLSANAHIETRPQLEILNNDVKAYHGATVGRLSPEALFYLRSRGLDADHARRMLTGAFAADVVERVPSEHVRAHLGRYLDRALGLRVTP